MIGQDGRLMGLALGKQLSQKEFDDAAATLRLRLQRAQEKAELEVPMHLGMIATANAVTEEIAAIAAGKLSPDDRRLSSPKTNIHRIQLFRDASDEAERRLSGGKLGLEFQSKLLDVPISMEVSAGHPKVVPSEKKPKPR
ncbi:hypothetical protein [Hydrogenophaga sp. 2FB]|uniref:hypothetical protein n=1 Tax=Hydrogenophaga sp. 2FB TaxID=2502187 RepID=UPI0010F51073|nr:hypothetical protein [Hydrogenophaga sp. 2FB]